MLINSPFGTEKFLTSIKIPFDDRPLCDICQYGEARCDAVHDKNTKVDSTSEGDLKKNHLRSGA